MKHLLKPVEAPYDDEVEALLSRYPKQDGYLLKLFRVFGNSARFLVKGMPNLLDDQSPLKLRERELVILRICANNQCEYEWGVHVSIFARAAQLSDEQIANTSQATLRTSLWSQADLLLLQVVDDLCAHSTIQTNLLDGFQAMWTQEQQLEIFALAGAYHTVSFVANNSMLEVEEFAARFPR